MQQRICRKAVSWWVLKIKGFSLIKSSWTDVSATYKSIRQAKSLTISVANQFLLATKQKLVQFVQIEGNAFAVSASAISTMTDNTANVICVQGKSSRQKVLNNWNKFQSFSATMVWNAEAMAFVIAASVSAMKTLAVRLVNARV